MRMVLLLACLVFAAPALANEAPPPMKKKFPSTASQPATEPGTQPATQPNPRSKASAAGVLAAVIAAAAVGGAAVRKARKRA